MYQEQLNDRCETHQRAFGLKESCIGKLDRCNDRKICGKLSVNETVETSVTSTCLSEDSEQAHAYRNKHQMQVKLEYCYT